MAFSGLRSHDLQKLTLKDVPDLIVQKRTVQFVKVPTKIVPQPKLQNPSVRTFTFLCEPGCNYFIDYLKERQRKGEKLTPQTPLIPAQSPHIIPTLVTRAIRTAGFDFRPYDLRHFFLTQLMRAESDGLIDRDIREFISGYVVKEPLMPRHPTPQMEQMMRDAYRKSADKYLIP
jgi:integrase